MPVETPVRRRWRVRHRPRLIPCLLALVAVLLVIKWIDPFAPGERPLPETPDWITVELLPLNEFSRPGTPLEEVNGIVIHYVGNPGTTAAQNHSFFTNLAQTGETYASSHFLVGLDGEVLQNVPLNEVAYCSNQRNDDTISAPRPLWSTRRSGSGSCGPWRNSPVYWTAYFLYCTHNETERSADQ